MLRAVSKATHQQTRTHNQQLVLRTIYDRSAMSRADVARDTGLTRTSVSDLVGELLEAGLVEEVGRGPSSGGKAPILLRVAADARHVLGMDLGESVFSGAVVNLRGEILHSVELPLEGRNGDEALELCFELADRLRRASDRPLLGVGIGTPGVIDSAAGSVRWAVNLDWSDLALGPMVAERLGTGVLVANDSQAAALAEYTFGPLPRPDNMIVVKVGRGIGAGVVLNGRLFQGDGFAAGEIGHTVVVEDGAACRCGNRGCVETVASLRGMAEVAARLADEEPGSLLAAAAKAGSIDDARLVQAFAHGDPLARRVVLAGAHHLAASIAALAGVLDVERVVIVGSAVALGEEWIARIPGEVRRRVLQRLGPRMNVVAGTTGENVVVLGASALLMTRELGLVPAR